MNPNNAKRLLDGEIASGSFDTYALLCFDGRERAFASSQGINEDTLFDIASMGKVLVTSTLILHAAGEGLLSLDDPLGKYFPFAPAEKRKIPLRMLLTHSSGIIRIELPDDIGDRSRAEAAACILNVPLAFEPGTHVVYSCNGFILLGYVVEQVYGMPLDKVFDTVLRGPMGYTRTCFNMPAGTPNAAVTHYRREAGACQCADSNVCRMHGVAGSGASFWTAADIERFAQAVLRRDERLYPRALFDLSETDLTPGLEEGRGLGWLVVRPTYAQTGGLFPTGSFGHCGNTGTSLFIDRTSGSYAILLTNATRFSYIRNNFTHCNYGETMLLRERVHRALT